MEEPVLYIVATPIGNLKDISLRAIEALKEADFILCEDTRVTRKLLDHYNIAGKRLISYHQHSKLNKVAYITDLLRGGNKLALVSDAGTPGLSDPGNELIRRVLDELGNSVRIVPIPGPSALAAIASVAGIPMDTFLFMGFLPHKKKRKKMLAEIGGSKRPVVIYESPYRVLRTLRELCEINPKLNIIAGKELTKFFETIYRGNIRDVIEQIQKKEPKGEWVIVAYQAKAKT